MGEKDVESKERRIEMYRKLIELHKNGAQCLGNHIRNKSVLGY